MNRLGVENMVMVKWNLNQSDTDNSVEFLILKVKVQKEQFGWFCLKEKFLNSQIKLSTQPNDNKYIKFCLF